MCCFPFAIQLATASQGISMAGCPKVFIKQDNDALRLPGTWVADSPALHAKSYMTKKE